MASHNHKIYGIDTKSPHKPNDNVLFLVVFCTEEKDVLHQQKQALETALKETQDELATQTQLREACDVNLAGCEAKSADLETRLDEANARGDRLQEELDATKQRLQEVGANVSIVWIKDNL